MSEEWIAGAEILVVFYEPAGQIDLAYEARSVEVDAATTAESAFRATAY